MNSRKSKTTPNAYSNRSASSNAILTGLKLLEEEEEMAWDSSVRQEGLIATYTCRDSS